MSFVDRVTSFSDRFLTDRSFDLIVAPALADFQFDTDSPGALRRVRNYLGVLAALAGAIREDLTRDSASFVLLALLPACYYAALLVIIFDFRWTSSQFVLVGGLVLAFSLGPVLACFWPERAPRRMPTEAP